MSLHRKNATPKMPSDASLNVMAESTAAVVTIPALTGLSGTYFVELSLSRGATLASSNFYWLPSNPETIDLGNSDWYHTPTSSYADYRALATLAPATLNASASAAASSGATASLQVTLDNRGSTVAFFTRLELTAGKGGKIVAPVFWQDNYLSLLPNESRTVSVSYAHADLAGAAPAVEV